MKHLVLLALMGVVIAGPLNFQKVKSKEEVDKFREFLYKTQKERNITLKEAMIQHPQNSPWVNSGKFNGDILLRDEEIEEMVAEYAGNATPHVYNGLLNNRHRWPRGEIVYDIAPNTFNAAQIEMIVKATKVFQKTTCTRWVRRTNQRDYVFITGRNNGCYTHVGYWANSGKHTLNLAPGCFNFYVVLHEMLHSMGFHHMHQSYAREDWVKINWQYVTRGMEHNFNIYKSNMVTMFDLPYEYASNQHYEDSAFSNTPGKPTIVALRPGGHEMGQLTRLTSWDVLRIARMYNCPGAWSVPVRLSDASKGFSEEFYVMMKQAEIKEEERQALAEGRTPLGVKIKEEEVKAVIGALNPPVKSLI